MKKIVPLNIKDAFEHVQGIGPNAISGHPVTNVWRCFEDHSGHLTAGIWSCEGGSFEIFSHTSNEMCAILEGEAVIEHSDGSKVTVGPGDSFMIPYGAHTIWHVPNFVKKAFICNFAEEDKPTS